MRHLSTGLKDGVGRLIKEGDTLRFDMGYHEYLKEYQHHDIKVKWETWTVSHQGHGERNEEKCAGFRFPTYWGTSLSNYRIINR